jgi:hypothetical protein
MPGHTRTQLEEMVSRAQTHVADGQKRILAQQARVAALDRKSRRADESKRLLKTMEDTQYLQIRHLDLLRRELHEKDLVPSALTAPHDLGG